MSNCFFLTILYIDALKHLKSIGQSSVVVVPSLRLWKGHLRPLLSQHQTACCNLFFQQSLPTTGTKSNVATSSSNSLHASPLLIRFYFLFFIWPHWNNCFLLWEIFLNLYFIPETKKTHKHNCMFKEKYVLKMVYGLKQRIEMLKPLKFSNKKN